MKIVKLRDNTAIAISDEADLSKIMQTKKRFILIGDIVVNRADIVSILSKEQYDAQIKLSAGMVLTSQGWLSKREYSNQSYLKVIHPPELDFAGNAQGANLPDKINF